MKIYFPQASGQTEFVLPVYSPFKHRTLTVRTYNSLTREDLLAPGTLLKKDIKDPNIKHYFFSLNQIVNVFPFLRDAFESTVRIAGGSGFLISNHGHILTNAHVVESMISGSSISLDTKEDIVLSNGQRVTLQGAELIHRGDDRSEPDVAIIRVPGLSGRKFIQLSKDETKVGERIFLIGNPGIIGKQVISIGTVCGASNIPCISTNFIHSDCLSYGGNSGGPLIDLFGRCVGLFKGSGITSGGVFLQSLVKDDQKQGDNLILQSVAIDSSTLLEVLKSKDFFLPNENLEIPVIRMCV